MANTLATAATAPFAGAISDLIGRRSVAMLGLCLTIAGMLVAGLAGRVSILIGGSALQGVGAGLAELIASAGVMELVSVRDRGKYVGLFYLLFLPICGCGAYGSFLLIIIDRSPTLFPLFLALGPVDLNHFGRRQPHIDCYLLSSSPSSELFGIDKTRSPGTH